MINALGRRIEDIQQKQVKNLTMILDKSKMKKILLPMSKRKKIGSDWGADLEKWALGD